MFIGEPFPIRAQVIAIEHGGNRIHPNAINMKLLEPIHQIRNQEITHLIATVVKDQRAPLLVFANAGIGMFVEVSSIEEGQTMGVLGKVTRHPVENHANACGVAAIYEVAEFIRTAKATGGGIPARYLIAPRTIKGMLRDRHQLDVGETTGLYIGDHPIGQFRVGEQSGTGLEIGGGHRRSGPAIGFQIGLVGTAMHPAAQMHLVHRDRLIQRIGAIALLHPGAIGPGIAAQGLHDRTIGWPHLVAEAVGICLLIAVAGLGADLVLVNLTRLQAGDEQLPAAPQPTLHRVMAAIPAVEVAKHGHAAGIGGPEAEANPLDAPPCAEVGTHPLPDVVMVALGEQVAIHLAHPLIPEGPGVVGLVFDAPPRHPHPIAAARVDRQFGFKNPAVVGVAQGDRLPRHQPMGASQVARQQQIHPIGLWHPDAHHPIAVVEGLGAEQREGVIVTTFLQTPAVVHHPVEADRSHGALSAAP